MSSLKNPIRLLLLGAPGSGKGTQTSRLLKQFNSIQSVSSGDLLRREMNANSNLGKLASTNIADGKLIPDEFICGLLTTYLDKNNWLTPNASWLLDGFPRTENQAKILDQTLISNKADLNLVVELDVPKEVILERIENRYIHVPSGRVYNLQYNPPKVPGKDDITGEPLTKRSDDNVEVFSKRLEVYDKTLGPLKEFYGNKGILRTISGETSDIIFPQLKDLLIKKFN